MEQKVRFDEWDDVNDCNTCECYWNTTCDGKRKDSPKDTAQNSQSTPKNGQIRGVCKGYLPIRRVLYLEQINTLKKCVISLFFIVGIMAIGMIIAAIQGSM